MSMLTREVQVALRTQARAMAASIRRGGFTSTPEQFGADLTSFLYEYLETACELGYREAFMDGAKHPMELK